MAAGIAAGAAFAATLPGIQTGPAPWAPEIAHLADRLRAIGLPALTQEGTALHIHQHLDVLVNGRRVEVPAGIGINDNEFIAPLHTHDPSGVIHVESPTLRSFTLGQFFAVWGVRFTPRCLGGYCGSLRVYVDGRRVAGDPTKLKLASHQEIAVVAGRSPMRIPSRYSFPAGL